MIIHLDSTFRNIGLYPFPAEFEIDFNGQPPPNLIARDPRAIYLTSDYAQFAFRWIGDTMLPGISTRTNDALRVEFIPINPSTGIFVPSGQEDLIIQKSDYYVGISFYELSSGLSAIINSYTSDIFRFTLDQPIFQEYFGDISPQELVNSKNAKSNTRIGYLVNSTYTTGKNLLVLGSTKLIQETPSEAVLAKGLNTDLFVQNITRNWVSRIVSIEGKFRNVILDQFPSYESNDSFIIWREPPDSGRCRQPLFIDGIWEYHIRRSTGGFAHGDIVTSDCNDARFRVLLMGCDGSAESLLCLNPGNSFHPGCVVILRKENENHPDGQIEIEIVVLNVGNGLIAETVPSKIVPGTKNHYLVSIFQPESFDVLYFSINDFKEKNVLYIDITSSDAEALNIILRDYLGMDFPFFLIPFTTNYPTINAPIVPYQNAVCYEVEIVSISLPNLPVCGFNVLLADIPFIFVSLQNVSGPSNESYGTIISNNPNSNSANFICPIANIRNPDIIKFVVVKSLQRVVFKFTPRNSIRLKITLPNGALLRYANTFIPYVTTCDGSVSNTSCPSINQPLTARPNSPNTVEVYPRDISGLISATFMFYPIE